MRFILVIILLLLSSVFGQGAEVEPNPDTAIIQELLSLETFITDLSSSADELRQFMLRIASWWVSLALAVGIIKVIAGQAKPQVVFGSFLFGSAIILASIPIAPLMSDLWSTTINATGDLMADVTSGGGAKLERLADVGKEFNDLNLSWAVILDSNESLVPGTSELVNMGSLAKSISLTNNFLNVIALGISLLSVFAYITLALTSVTITIAHIILPITGALFVSGPRAGAQWFGLYTRALTSALIYALVLPLIFSAAYKLAIDIPVTKLADKVQAQVDILKSTEGRINAETLILETLKQDTNMGVRVYANTIDRLINDPSRYKDGVLKPITQRTVDSLYEDIDRLIDHEKYGFNLFSDNVSDIMNTQINRVWAETRTWFFTVIVLVSCLIGALLLIFQGERMVSQLVGGYASSAAGVGQRFVSGQLLSAAATPARIVGGALSRGGSAVRNNFRQSGGAQGTSWNANSSRKTQRSNSAQPGGDHSSGAGRSNGGKQPDGIGGGAHE